MAAEGKPAPLVAVLPLVGLAGCVDAVGWLRLEGLFVSFMSGTTTMLGAAAATGQQDRAMTLAAAVSLFAVGALVGFGLARALPRWRTAAVLGLVAVLLALGWRSGDEGALLPQVALTLLPAMGALNAALPGVGGITFVTGALTRGAEGVVAALAGETGTGWWRHFATWSALVVGALVGGTLSLRLPQDALAVPMVWAAVGCVLALTAAFRRRAIS